MSLYFLSGQGSTLKLSVKYVDIVIDKKKPLGIY